MGELSEALQYSKEKMNTQCVTSVPSNWAVSTNFHAQLCVHVLFPCRAKLSRPFNFFGFSKICGLVQSIKCLTEQLFASLIFTFLRRSNPAVLHTQEEEEEE
jgi:hypothetical protein